MGICRKHMKKVCCCLSTAVLTCSTGMAYGVAAQTKETDGELEFEGVTQLSSQDWYPEEDLSEAELVVEEVLVEAGSQVKEGDQILKLTQESYEDAAAHYNAAAIKADNELTDTQLAYDQGILESRYTYETAKMKAEQAELVKQYQQTELTSTIDDHETVLTEIDERIAELESGIASGSYESGGTSFSSGKMGSGSSGGLDNFSEKEAEEKESETLPDEMAETQSGTAESEAPETQSESAQSETPDTEGETLPDETPDTEGGTLPDETPDTEDEMEVLRQQIEEKKTQYQEILEQLEALFEAGQQESEAETGDGTTQEQTDETAAASELTNRIQELQTQLQSSIDGNTNVKTNLENVQKNLSSVPEELLKVVKQFYPDYQSYTELLASCIAQLGSDIQQQQSVKEALGSLHIGNSSSDSSTEQEQSGNTSIDTEQILSLFTQLSQVEEEKNGLYAQLISVQSEKIAELEETLQSESGQSEGQPPEGQQSESGQSEGQQSESGQSEGQPPEGQQSENENTKVDGNLQGGMTNGNLAGAMSGGSSGGVSGNISGGMSASMETVGSGSDLTGLGDSGDGTLSDEEISLFGSTYDLTQVKELLEREPSDSDTAQELADQLYEKRETVQRQYDELLRNQTATELQIQYTYDTTVLAGALAGFTWEQEKQEWEEQLAQAKAEKADIAEKLEWLTGLEDGIITADRAGVISSVSYEEGDTISQDTPLLSYYDTDTLTISFEVEQEQIHLLQVGDTVSVSIGGWQTGTDAKICEKGTEPIEGTSRTAVKYEASVSLDNSEGLYSSGTSATIRIGSDQNEENNTEQVKENE